METWRFSLWTQLQNFEIMLICRRALRQVEFLAVDTAAEFRSDARCRARRRVATGFERRGAGSLRGASAPDRRA